jgi:hypothetical protein
LGLNPRTLDTRASTLTIIPPRRHVSGLLPPSSGRWVSRARRICRSLSTSLKWMAHTN